MPPLPTSSPCTHHSTSQLIILALPHLRWKFSHPPSRLPEPASASDQSRHSHPHHRHSSLSAPSPELKPAPPLPKPAPYEYGHSSSQPQPQPESSSVLLRSPLALHRLSTVTSHSSTLQTHPLWRSRRENPPSTPHVSGTRHRSCLCISTTKFPSTDTPTLPSSYSSFATRGSLVAPIPAPTVEQNRQQAPDAFMFMPTYQPNIQVCPMLKQSPVYH